MGENRDPYSNPQAYPQSVPVQVTPEQRPNVPGPQGQPYVGQRYPARQYPGQQYPQNPGIKPANTPQAPSRWDVPMWALVAAIVVGAALALVAIPLWVPTLGASLVGAEPKVSWYLSRATGMVSFVLLWFSMASGLIISNKMARVWPGAFTAYDLHQYTSLLGLGFGLFHGLILMANSYINYSFVQVLVPFSNPDYRTLWVGIGQVALYVGILVTVTFYLRKQIGKAWRVIHYLSYGVFGMALLHGLFSGTDSGNVWIMWMYWLATVSLAGLTFYRVIQRQANAAKSQP